MSEARIAVVDARWTCVGHHSGRLWVRKVLQALPDVAPSWRWIAAVREGHGECLRAQMGGRVEPVEIPANLRGPAWASALGDVADRHGADVALCQYWCATDSQTPQVAVVHDVLSVEHPHFFAQQQRSAFGAALESCRSASAAIAVSTQTASALSRLRLPGSGRRFVVANGADHVFDEPLPCPHDHLAGSTRYVVYIGRLNDRKNIDVLAAATREHNWPGDLGVAVIGEIDGLHDATTEALAGLVAEGRAISCGQLHDRCAFSVLRSSVAAVYVPSVEGYGLPVVEAAALGVPVVATLVPAVADVPVGAVFVVAVRDPVALAAAIASIASIAATERTGRTPNRHENRSRSWAQTAAGVASVLDQVL